MLDDSAKTVSTAYERMQLGPRHTWARKTEHEVAFALRTLGITPTARVLDLGCGHGRHALSLAQTGASLVGVDFVASFVAQARVEAEKQALTSVQFVEGDAREVNVGFGSFDAALCLYDVVGTFPEEQENQRILENLARHLRKGARALISVLNMELTQHLARNLAVVADDPEALQRLLPSTLMRESGNIFDSERFLLDPETHVVYRREQFEGDGRPPGELPPAASSGRCARRRAKLSCGRGPWPSVTGTERSRVLTLGPKRSSHSSSVDIRSAGRQTKTHWASDLSRCIENVGLRASRMRAVRRRESWKWARTMLEKASQVGHPVVRQFRQRRAS